MSTAAAMRHERDEHPDPRNRLLDVFEVMVESLIDNDLEVQLRTRFDRLLPPIKANRATDAERALNFAIVMKALTTGRRRYSEAELDLIRRARQIVAKEMEIS